jgi:hypothetical protein
LPPLPVPVPAACHSPPAARTASSRTAGTRILKIQEIPDNVSFDVALDLQGLVADLVSDVRPEPGCALGFGGLEDLDAALQNL